MTATPSLSPSSFSKEPYIHGPSMIIAAVPEVKAVWAGPSLSAAFGATATCSLCTRSKANCTPSTNFGSVRVFLPSWETCPPKEIPKSPGALPRSSGLTATPYCPSPVSVFASERNCAVVYEVVGAARPAFSKSSRL